MRARLRDLLERLRRIDSPYWQELGKAQRVFERTDERDPLGA